jgi:hypothetical protein
LTNLLLREVFARPGAWTWTDPAAGQGIGDRLEPPAAQPDATPVAV